MSESVVKGQWWRLPSGQVVEIRRVRMLDLPLPVDAAPGTTPAEFAEAVIRYLNNDGAMAPGEFHLSCAFLTKRATRVKVAPPQTVSA